MISIFGTNYQKVFLFQTMEVVAASDIPRPTTRRPRRDRGETRPPCRADGYVELKQRAAFSQLSPVFRTMIASFSPHPACNGGNR